MRILEARDGFIKFESNEKLAISSFVQISGFKHYIAQVVKVTNLEDSLIGYAKLIYTYDGSFGAYDNSLPTRNSEIKPFSFDKFRDSIISDSQIIAGKFIENEAKIPVGLDCFDKNLLISIDNSQNCERLISNFSQQFAKFGNIVVIDMLGVMNGRKKVAAVDFKLPLNTETLEFLYEDCLNDATSESKNLIKEIFMDLAEYSRAVSFLPFGILKNIVDDMVTRSHIFKLIVLKNKLAKFERFGYFASNVNEVESLSKILSEKECVIDLSKLDSIFQNRYLSTILAHLDKLDEKPQVFVLASNSLNKRNIKTLLTTEELASTLVAQSRFKYLNEIKSMFKNFIIEPSFTNNETFKIYKTFLEAMPKESYLLVGEVTNYIPLVSFNKEYVADEDTSELTLTEEIEDIEAKENNYKDLEEALGLTEEKDAQEEAIDKKSEDLIEKIAEDLNSEQPKALNIFSEDDSEEEFEEEPEETNSEDNSSDSEDENTEETPDNLEIVEELTEKDLDGSGDDSNETVVVEATEDAVTETQEETEVDEEDESEVVEEIIIPKNISELAEIDDDAEQEEIIPETESIVEPENELDTPSEVLVDTNDDDNVEYKTVVTSAVDEETPVVPAENESNELADENVIEEEVTTEVVNVIPISDDEEVFEEIVELDSSDIGSEDIIIEFDEEEVEDGLIDSTDLDKEIIEDVDKVFTTIKEDTISDSDLDFIDELNSDSQEDIELEEITEENSFEELPEMLDESEEVDFIEPLEEVGDNSYQQEDKEILQTKNSSTPIVPVYEAVIPQEDLVESDKFEQGDAVTHAKYGVGVVEKMIKYGAKTLYSINFDNVGRRLLDPTLTEIKKV